MADTDLDQLVSLGGIYLNMENGSNGQSISSAQPWINGATDGTVSTEQSRSGTRCFKTFIDPKSGGFGSYGGIIGEKHNMPQMLRYGEVWQRAWVFHPTSWKNECSPHMKFLRMETINVGDSNPSAGGYSDLYLDGNRLKYIAEPQSTFWTWAPSGYDVVKGQWICYEVYTKLDTVPQQAGGQGRAIVWRNGVRVIDETNTKTMKNTAGYSSRVLWYTWHQTGTGQGGGATQRRITYLDDWTIAFRGNSRSHGYLDCTGAMDSEGGMPFIGMNTGGATTPPTQPLTPVTNFRSTGTTATTVTMQWDYSGTEHNSFEFAGRVTGGSWSSGLSLERDLRAGTLEDLPETTDFEFRIRAIGSQSSSEFSYAFATTGSAPVNPGVPDPENLRITSTGETTMSIAWNYGDDGTVPPNPGDLAAPTSLAVEVNDDTEQIISWTYATGGDGDINYVERWITTTESDYSVVATKTVGDPQFNEYISTGLPKNTLVKYRVRAYDTDTVRYSAYASTEGTTTGQPTGSTDLDNVHYYENFTGGSVGDNVTDSTAFVACSNGVITTDNPYPGGTTRSMRSTVPFGETGWSKWGFVYENSRNSKPGPLNIQTGGEVWYRVAIRYDDDWEWGTNGGANPSPNVKGFRLYRGSDGNDKGSIEFAPFLAQSGQLSSLVTSGTPDAWNTWGPGTQVQNGRWYMQEVYCKYDTQGVDSGGSGELKVWQDGVYIGSQKFWNGLLTASNHYGGRFMYHTYWNADAPKTQSCQYAHVAWAYRGNTTSGYVDMTGSMDRDSNNFPFLGLAVK